MASLFPCFITLSNQPFFAIQVNDEKTEWVPKDTMYSMDFDDDMNADVGVFFVNLGSDGGVNDEAVIRLLDETKTSSKMLTIKVMRREGRVAVYESSRSSGFFFASGERDYEKAHYEDMEALQRYCIGLEIKDTRPEVSIIKLYRVVNCR